MHSSTIVREEIAGFGSGKCRVLEDALDCRRILGSSEFYLSFEEMARVMESVIGRTPRPVLSLNRPQAGGRTLVHRIGWCGLVFSCVSYRPFIVV